MNPRLRWFLPVAPIAIALIVRWVHVSYRAPKEGSEGFGWYFVLGLIFALTAAIFGAPPRSSRLSAVPVSALGAVIAGTGTAATMTLIFPGVVPRFAILATGLFFGLWVIIVGAFSAFEFRRSGSVDRIVVVSAAEDMEALAAESFNDRLESPFGVVGSRQSDPPPDDLIELCVDTNAAVVVLGPKAILSSTVVEQASALHKQGVRVRSLERFYDERLGKLPLSSLDRFSLMGDIESLHGSYAPLKRAFDILLAGLGAIVLLLLMPFVLAGNLIGNRGPLLFRQERIGFLDQPFSIIKLRTMAPGAIDVSGWTSNNDPRITSFGKLLRRTHIDELPQVVNILRGELSVVGPRPEQATYVHQLQEALPFYSARHLVRPGLTGWAQVRYRYAASEEDAFAKLQFDLHYVRHESFTTDLRIIGLTLRHILSDGGR